MSKLLEHRVRWQPTIWRAAAPAVLAAGLALVPGATAALAGGSWQGIGPGGGVALSLAVDPTNPGIVYAASDAGGLFKTVDGGRSWSHSDAGLLGHAIRVVIDPTAPATVYAATGFNSLGGGIFKSTDGGAAWTSASDGIDGLRLEFLRDLAIDSQTAATLYAAADDRVFKSVDGGASWFDSGAGLRSQVSVLSVAVDPVQPAVVYAGTAFGVWKSVDAGATWHPARTGMGRPSVVGLAVDPGGRGTVYAATRPNGSSSPRAIPRTRRCSTPAPSTASG
jgi:hypothetical protein